MADSPPLALLASTLSSVPSTATNAVVQASQAAVTVYPMPSMDTSGGVMGFLQLLPGVLLWLIGFITITLPTWTFTLFQTSLTITMNATTMYVDVF